MIPTNSKIARTLSLGIIAAAALFYLATVATERNFQRQKSYFTSDLAFTANILYNTNFKDRWLYADTLVEHHGFSCYLNEHFSPVLLALAPFYRLFPDPLLLVHIQSLSPLLAGLLLALVALELGLSSLQAAMFFVIWIFNPVLLKGTLDGLYGFHMDCIIPPLFFSTWLLLLKGRMAWFWASLAALLGCKENIPITAAALAAYCIWKVPGGPIPAKRTLALSLTFTFAAFAVGWASDIPNRHIAHALELSSLPHPHLGLFARCWWPLLLMPFYASNFALLALVEIAINLVEGDPFKWWHCYPILCVLSAAAILGAARLQKRSRKASVNAIICAFALLSIWISAPWLIVELKSAASLPPRLNPAEARLAIALVPAEASLSVSCDLMPWSANRHHLVWTSRADEAEYLLLNNGVSWPLLEETDLEFSKIFNQVLKINGTTLVWKSPGGLVLIHKHISPPVGISGP